MKIYRDKNENMVVYIFKKYPSAEIVHVSRDMINQQSECAPSEDSD